MTNNHSTAIVQRLWNYCNVLRDDGVSYGDYVEQLTYLLFLKMDDEQVRLLGKTSAIPAGVDWQSLAGLTGDELEAHYRHILAELGKGSSLIPTNPPFGKKSSVTYATDQGEIKREAQSVVRDDFWTSTSNKQLNFVQHVKTLLKVNGRAAVVVPDNVLFEGGAGETVRRKLLHECDDPTPGAQFIHRAR